MNACEGGDTGVSPQAAGTGSELPSNNALTFAQTGTIGVGALLIVAVAATIYKKRRSSKKAEAATRV